MKDNKIKSSEGSLIGFDYEKSKLKSTVGYNECEHKAAFLLGAEMCYDMMIKWHEGQIVAIKESLNTSSHNANVYRNDLETLAEIIKRYTQED